MARLVAENFMALEQQFIARLREVLPANVHVLSAADLAGVAEEVQLTPAVHVLYRSYRPGDIESDAFAGVEQDWLTVVAVRHLADPAIGAQARQEAGPLAGAVIAALHRHRFEGYKPLRLGAAPASGFSKGHFYLPIGWRAAFKVRSDQC